MSTLLDRSLERGVLDRVVRRLPLDRQPTARKRLRRLTRPAFLGTLRWTAPVSRKFGYDRGTPVDRYYIDRFLGENRGSIRGRVLEVKDSGYTDRFGMNVTAGEVLDIDPSNRLATIVDDLARLESIPDDSFDCIILTHTLQYIEDFRGAVSSVHRVLRPQGTVLATMPTMGRIDAKQPHLVEYWRATPAAYASLFGEVFGAEAVDVRAYGSCITAIAFIAGMAQEELTARELERDDPPYAVMVAVRGVKG